MNRDFLTQLVEWRLSDVRKPLILDGVRQVGKTYAVRAFGAENYQNIVEFNFEQDPSLVELFEGALDPIRLLTVMKASSGQPINPETTLLFFDEVQQCERALTSLKYFCEIAPQYHIVAAGSLLGLRLKTTTAFPVGKVNFLTVYPMTFLEFLDARGEGSLRKFIESQDPREPFPAPLRNKLEENLRYYYYVGGMPEPVAAFCERTDFVMVRELQRAILKSYMFDFSKYAAPHETLKISAIWDSVPILMSKENKKFIFSAIKHSARAREYETALQWLIDAGLVIKVLCTEHPTSPLMATALGDVFKIYLLDVGLLGAMVNLDSRSTVTGDEIFGLFAGALAENYVAQTLRASGWDKLYYWTSQHRAEVDFLIEHKSQPLPIEVKSGLNTQSRSLQAFCKKYSSTLAIKTSLQVQGFASGVYNCPLYALETLGRALDRLR